WDLPFASRLAIKLRVPIEAPNTNIASSPNSVLLNHLLGRSDILRSSYGTLPTHKYSSDLQVIAAGIHRTRTGTEGFLESWRRVMCGGDVGNDPTPGSDAPAWLLMALC